MLPSLLAPFQIPVSPSHAVTLLRLTNAKSVNFSISKKQCDLWENMWGTAPLVSHLMLHCDLSNCDVLELGAGLGLVSLTLATSLSAPPKSILVTDLVADALYVFEQAIPLNPTCRRDIVSTRTLDWNKPETVPSSAFDLVIGSDVLFISSFAKPVARAVARALRPNGVCVVGDPFRLNDEVFLEELRELGFVVAAYEFDSGLIQAYVAPLLSAPDSAFNSVVKVQRAKLLLAHRGESPCATRLVQHVQAFFTR